MAGLETTDLVGANGQVKVQRKKKGPPTAQLDPEQASTSDSDGMELDANLRIVDRNATRIRRADGEGMEEGDDVEFDSDPVLGYARFHRPRARSPDTSQQQAEGGSVEVDVPDELQSVLALQQLAAPASQITDEDSLVKGLLYTKMRLRGRHLEESKGV